MALFSRHATLEWSGDVLHGSGTVTTRGESVRVSVTYPRLAGEPEAHTTPEELLAASHATCCGIGLRSVIGQRGGVAQRIRATATVTAEKGAHGIRIRSAHLHGEVEGLTGIAVDELPAIAKAAEEGCTISALVREAVPITVDVVAM